MNRKGFTLIELLIVVVIIGILAAIAIPKFANTKEKAYIASMKSDLRNLVTAEEAYFSDSVKYGTTVSCANPPPAGAVAFCATSGNALAVPTVGVGTQAGWTTSITNVNTTKSCGIYVGAVTPAAPATSADPEGAPVCR
jgi:prepilin-type N-terminal cleavage/methylation domain-containing protein